MKQFESFSATPEPSPETPPSEFIPEQRNISELLQDSFELTASYESKAVPGVTINEYLVDLHNSDENLPPYKIVEYIPPQTEEIAIDEKPIVFMQGFMSGTSDYGTAMSNLAVETNKRVLGWDQISGAQIGNDVSYPISETRDEEDMYRTQRSKVLAMDETLRRLHISDAELLAHSEGVIHALLLQDVHFERTKRATHVNESLVEQEPRPDDENDYFPLDDAKRTEQQLLFNKMVLLNPAGILDRSINDLRKSGSRELNIRKEGDGGEYGTPEDLVPTGYRGLSIKDPARLWKTGVLALQSTLGLAGQDVTDLVRKYRDLGVDMKIVSGDHDQHFAIEELEEFAHTEGIPIKVAEKTDHAGLLYDQTRFEENVMPTFTEPPANRNYYPGADENVA